MKILLLLFLFSSVQCQCPFEATEVVLPTTGTIEEKLIKQDQLLADLGEQGYGLCYAPAGASVWYCVRPRGNTGPKFTWHRWPWINGRSERLALANQIASEGYVNVLIWQGQIRAAKPK